MVASTDKAALAASFYGRTKRFMEQLMRVLGPRGRARSGRAVRFVNVLASAGSASELFLRQSRAGVPLTVTDTGMLRYWITMGARRDPGRTRRAAGRRRRRCWRPRTIRSC